MESVKSFIFFPSIAGVLLLGITLIVNVLYMVMEGFYELFSRPKCPTPPYLPDLVKSAEAKRWIPPEGT